MKVAHVLIVGGQIVDSESMRASLNAEGVRLSLADSAKEGLSVVEREPLHLVVADLDAPGVDDGFFRDVASAQPLARILGLVAARALEAAQRTIHVSQVDYLLKPLVAEAIRTALRGVSNSGVQSRRNRTEAESAAIAETPSCGASSQEDDVIIAQSPAMRDILRLLPRIARTDAAVLIQGEPDTGKGLIARSIHRQSRRAAGPFVRIACGGLRERELEERLFGERESAGDTGRPPAILEQAHRGTLFLDNVSQLPLWVQVRLLDLFQQRANPRQVARPDVRLIASSTCDLRAAAATTQFDSSLYYYLSVVEIDVPPLRHRPQDIRAIADHYLAIANAERQSQGEQRPRRFSREAYDRLLAYDWPGNALQLAGVVARAVVLADKDEIAEGDVTESLDRTACHSDSESIRVPLAGGLKGIERSVIDAVIQRCRGNKAAAARTLRLHRRTLYRLLEQNQASRAASAVAAPALGGTVRQTDNEPFPEQFAF